MKIRLVNVGLVRDATISLADLTIIMGPNNSGKSTVATTLYAAIKSSLVLRGRGLLLRAPNTLVRQRRRYAISPRSLDSLARDLTKAISGTASGKEVLNALRGQAGRVSNAILKEYGLRFVAELEAGLGAPLSELATRGTRGRRLPLKVRIQSEQSGWAVEIRLRGDSPIIEPEVDGISGLPEDFSLPFDLSDTRPADLDEADYRYVLSAFSEQLGELLFSEFPNGAHYLPAARAGLLQSHRLVAAAMLQRSPFTGLSEVSMPRLSGVVADFVSEILLSEGRRASPYSKIARAIESDVLGGRVRQITTGTNYPEIEFTDRSGSYPIHRTSSMVSELAPIVLLLQRTIQRGDLLIVEEPESHLHPATQVQLARRLFEASRRGLFTVLTTHSDFFISEINNLIRQSVLSKTDLASGVSDAAYLVQPSKIGSKMKSLSIDPVDGISEESFTQVANELYDIQISQQLSLVEDAR